MSWIAAGAAVGGAALSAGGGLLGASSANRAARKQEDDQIKKAAYAQGILGTGMYGLGYSAFEAKFRRALEKATHDKNYTELEALQNSPEYAEYQKLTGGPLAVQSRNLGDRFAKIGDAQLKRYDRSTDELQRGSAGLEMLASQYGRGRDRIIRQDANESLTNLNQQAMARLNATGLGASSAVTNALRGNTTQVNRERDRSLQTSRDATTDRVLGARTRTLDQAANREQGRVGLWNIVQERNLGNRLNTLGMQQGTNTQAANIWAGLPTAAGPGVSGLGSALSGIGNSAAQFGSLMLMQKLFGAGGGGANPVGQIQNNSGLFSGSTAGIWGG